MLVYRVGKTTFANDLKGEGARLFGGRWNHPLTPCLYTSASRALAVLEYTVNVNIDDVPRALSITTIKIPPGTDILYLTTAQLPGNWKETPAPGDAKNFGTGLLKSGLHPVIAIPSAVIPEEYNYLVNPLHPYSGQCKIADISDFVYDVRIKLV